MVRFGADTARTLEGPRPHFRTVFRSKDGVCFGMDKRNPSNPSHAFIMFSIVQMYKHTDQNYITSIKEYIYICEQKRHICGHEHPDAKERALHVLALTGFVIIFPYNFHMITMPSGPLCAPCHHHRPPPLRSRQSQLLPQPRW